jgi:hypothetical protein
MYRMITILSIFSFLLASPLYAQVDTSSLSPDFSITTIPANPTPGQSIILQVESYSSDLTQATISWRYNGAVIASGIGKTRISSTAPQSGSTALISASVTVAGVSSTTALSLQPASVDLLWEAVDSYTPPFYKGKALLAPNGWVRTTAIPTVSAPKNVSYEWTRTDSVVTDASGYNRNSMIFKNESLKSQEFIAVTATSGAFSGTSSAILTPVAPRLITYQNKEGLVDYANGYADTIRTTNSGITLRFEPYFFSVPTTVSKNLLFDIKNGDNTIYGDTPINDLSLSAPETRGESDLDITIHTVLYSLQNIVTRFKIIFN